MISRSFTGRCHVSPRVKVAEAEPAQMRVYAQDTGDAVPPTMAAGEWSVDTSEDETSGEDLSDGEYADIDG